MRNQTRQNFEGINPELLRASGVIYEVEVYLQSKRNIQTIGSEGRNHQMGLLSIFSNHNGGDELDHMNLLFYKKFSRP